MNDLNETGVNGRAEPLESPGSLLKAARERQNLAIPDVARQLNLSATKVEALERDNYDKLASDVFAQGYIRRYARLLQMDDDLVVQRFNAWVAHQRAEQEPELQHSAAASSSAAASKWLIPAAIFVAAVAILVLIYRQTAVDDTRGPVINDSPAAEEQAREPEPAFEEQMVEDAEPPALPELRAVEPPAVNTQRQAPAPAVPSEAERTGTSAPAPSVAPAPDIAPVENPSRNPATANAADRSGSNAEQDLLTFAFSSDCWVEVKNAQGAVIYADVAKGGESLIVEGEAPFSIMLGNAEAASLTYNGELVSIPRRAGNRTARLTVGE